MPCASIDESAHLAAGLQLVAMVIMFVGVIFFGFVLSSLSSVLQTGSQAARRASAFRLKYEQVEIWMQRRHLPRRLREQITSYYSDVWVRQEGAPGFGSGDCPRQ